MNEILTLAGKDLRLLVRNRASLFWILAFPLLLALFFGLTFGSPGDRGANAISLTLTDEDDTPESRGLVSRLEKSSALKVTTGTREAGEEAVRRGKRVASLVIPKGYGEAARRFQMQAAGLELGIDPARQAEVGYLQGILTEATFAGLQEVFRDPNKMRKQFDDARRDLAKAKDVPAGQAKLLGHFLGELSNFLDQAQPEAAGAIWQPAPIKTTALQRGQKEPLSAFEVTFPSSILWAILACVQSFVISIAIERQTGTFLRLRIAPMRWWQVLAGKGLACFLACIAVTLLLLLVGRVAFGVRLTQPLHLAMAIVCTAACFVGMLMFLSTLGKTIEGVSGAAWGILLPMAMIGGGMIPLIAMPPWMLAVSDFSPVKWGIQALEGSIWRSFSLVEMLQPCGILLAVGAACFALGVKKLSWGEG